MQLRFILILNVLLVTAHPSYSQSENEIIEKTRSTWELPLQKFEDIEDNRARIRQTVYNSADSSWRFSADSCYQVRTVFPGKVIATFEIGQSHTIVIRFADYFFIYSNLKEPTVKKGDSLEGSAVIGRLRKGVDGNIFLDFTLMKGERMIDPQSWFKR